LIIVEAEGEKESDGRGRLRHGNPKARTEQVMFVFGPSEINASTCQTMEQVMLYFLIKVTEEGRAQILESLSPPSKLEKRYRRSKMRTTCI